MVTDNNVFPFDFDESTSSTSIKPAIQNELEKHQNNHLL